MSNTKKVRGAKLLKDKTFRTWYDGQSKEYLKKLYNTTKNKNLKSALLRLNNDAVRAARESKVLKNIVKTASNKTLGVVGMMGAGTLSASAGNVAEKSEGEQIKDLLTKHNLKGKKKKKGGKKYRDGGFLESAIPNLDDL